jgi:sugar O-acyltransferase (sialic acid O-acetyltransferase NeuD family)
LRGDSVIFWGAGGQARVLRECLGDDDPLEALFDNDPKIRSPFPDVPIFHDKSGFARWRADHPGPIGFAVAVGRQGSTRLRIQRWLVAEGLEARTIVHRTAFIAKNATVGAGGQILAQSAVCVDVQLGEGCLINTGASVDHECVLGEGVHIAPGARLAGEVRVGRHVFVGTGAVVRPRLTIGEGAVIGAGAVVVADVPAHVVMVGNPAHRLREVRDDER